MLLTAIFVLAAAVVGAQAGLVSCLVAEWLMAGDDLTPPRAWPPLVLDPLVQGLDALVWGGLVAFAGPNLSTLAAALLVLPLVQVAVTDLRFEYVYLPVAAVGILAGLVLAPLLQPVAWAGLAGALGGGLVFGLIYLLGLWLARVRYHGTKPMALGDVWIAAMVGAAAGAQTPLALIGGSVLGAVFLLASAAIPRRSLNTLAAYGPGLCAGGVLGLIATLAARGNGLSP